MRGWRITLSSSFVNTISYNTVSIVGSRHHAFLVHTEAVTVGVIGPSLATNSTNSLRQQMQ